MSQILLKSDTARLTEDGNPGYLRYKVEVFVPNSGWSLRMLINGPDAREKGERAYYYYKACPNGKYTGH
jgi:hypothetical protein